jgi:hypothetical protein
LAALIAVDNRNLAHQSTPSRLIENINYQLCRHIWRNVPPDNAARKLVLKTRQITKTAIAQPQISDVANEYARLSPSVYSSRPAKDWRRPAARALNQSSAA